MNKNMNLRKCSCLSPQFSLMIILSCLFIIMWTAPVSARITIKVSPPSDLTAGNESSNSVTLNWKDHSYNESGFRVEMSTDGKEFEDFARLPADATSYKCTGLTQDTRYWFRVQALGNDDALATLVNSDYSNVISTRTLTAPQVKTTLKPPRDLLASGEAKHIKLLWKDNDLGESGFNIERKIDNGFFISIAQVPANFVSYTDSDVREGFTYTYRIIAKGDGVYTLDSGYSNEAIATTKSKSSRTLNPPTNLTALAVSDSQIKLTWNDNTTNESGYSIERSIIKGDFSIIATLPANANTYLDEGLQDNTSYTYRVRALGTSSQSNYSNTANATTGKEASASPVILKFYIENNVYYINDQPNLMDTTPIISDGRTLLPIAYAAEPLGISVYWDEAERKVTLSRKGAVIEMWLDQSIARVNGVDTYIDPGNLNVAPRVYANRTMLPLSFVVSNLNCKVEWFSSMQEVRVTYPVPQDKRVQL